MRIFDCCRALLLTLISLSLSGCTGYHAVRDDIPGAVIAVEGPSLTLFRTSLGLYVSAQFRDGAVMTGYLVDRDGESFTLRGVGWQAARLTRCEIAELVAFKVSEPQPEGDRRY